MCNSTKFSGGFVSRGQKNEIFGTACVASHFTLQMLCEHDKESESLAVVGEDANNGGKIKNAISRKWHFQVKERPAAGCYLQITGINWLTTSITAMDCTFLKSAQASVIRCMFM